MRDKLGRVHQLRFAVLRTCHCSLLSLDTCLMLELITETMSSSSVMPAQWDWGATLLQDGRPVASASRSLTKSEKNYLALELECLAIVFACQKFDQYIYSKPVRVETDHKPLEVIAKKSILSAPRRLQRMLLQPQRYNLDIVYLPGEQQVVADVLSRAPVEQPREEQLGKAEVFQIVDQELAVIQEREFIPVSDARMAAVRSAAVQGQEQAMLRQIICQEHKTGSSHCEGLLEFQRHYDCARWHCV